MKLELLSVLFLCVCLASAAALQQQKKRPFLRTFEGLVNEVYRDVDGVYRFKFHLGDISHKEERTQSGKVRGAYAFVAPEGDEFFFKYEADKDGFQVESDALPKAPEDTDEVKQAKKEFFELYEKAQEGAESEGDDSSEEDDENEESEEHHDESSEEHNHDESSEEDDDEAEEEEEDEEEAEEEQAPKSVKKVEKSSAFTNVFKPVKQLKKSLSTKSKVLPSTAISHFSIPYPYSFGKKL